MIINELIYENDEDQNYCVECGVTVGEYDCEGSYSGLCDNCWRENEEG